MSFDITKIEDQELLAGLGKITEIERISRELREGLDLKKPFMFVKMSEATVVLSNEKWGLIVTKHRIGEHYRRWKRAADDRYNVAYTEFKNEEGTKRSVDELKALATHKVQREGYYHYVDGLLGWKQRIEDVYDAVSELINVYKKIVGEWSKIYGSD